jgi:hypothetical protein
MAESVAEIMSTNPLKVASKSTTRACEDQHTLKFIQENLHDWLPRFSLATPENGRSVGVMA